MFNAAPVKSGRVAIGYFSSAILSTEEGKEWGIILVHRKNHKKYLIKRLLRQFRRDFDAELWNHAVWDHFTGEIIGTIDTAGILEILREKYGYKIVLDD